MSDIRHALQEVVAEGGAKMARVTVTGAMRSSFAGIDAVGRSFRIDQAVVAHLRDGKIAEAWEIADVAALQARVARD